MRLNFALCTLLLGAAVLLSGMAQLPQSNENSHTKQPEAPRAHQPQPKSGDVRSVSEAVQKQPSAGSKQEEHECKYNGPAWFGGFYCFFAAHEKFWLSFGTLILAAATIILGVATAFLFFATRALVHGAETTAERQLRAYMFVKECFITNLDGPGKARYSIIIKNFGQTPAYKFSSYGAVKVGPFPNSDFSRDPDGDQRIVTKTIAPDGEVSYPGEISMEITPQIRSALKAGKSAIYAFGRIEYTDAFKNRRHSDFRYQFGGDQQTITFERDGIKIFPMVRTIEGNNEEDG